MTLAASSIRADKGVRTLVMREWDELFMPGKLTDTGRVMAESLRARSERWLVVDELRGGLRVRTRSWVGVVRLDDVEIRVEPKLAGDRLGLVRLLEVVNGIEGLTRLCGQASLEAESDNLLDLIALLFAMSCEGLVRRGLLAGYVEREDELPMVRGRILWDRQLLQRFGQLDRIHCRFDELEHDIVENQVLVAALRVACRHVRSSGVNRRLTRLRAVFEPICDIQDLDLRTVWDEITYNRQNAHYESTHALARILLAGLGIDDLLTPGSTRSFCFLLDMNALFERFVEQLVRRILPGPGYRVKDQGTHRLIVNVETGKEAPRVRPDVLVTSPNGAARLAIDAKYKLYDERALDSGDVYQMFLYAYGLSAQAKGMRPTALVLYPASGEHSRPWRLQVRRMGGGVGAEVTALGVPIPQALSEMVAGERGVVLGGLADVVAELLGLSGSKVLEGEPALPG